DINELDANGYSILHYAILKEDLDTTQLLISLGADVNFKENKNGRGNSALDISICIRNKEIFEVLLNSQNILLNETNEWGVTPLMTIIDIDSYRMEDKLEIMESLIDRGSDVNFIDIFGHSPLTCAIQKRSLSMVRLLIEHGANVNYI
ncbi:ankyrin, partial [Neocallimastix californiae]